MEKKNNNNVKSNKRRWRKNKRKANKRKMKERKKSRKDEWNTSKNQDKKRKSWRMIKQRMKGWQNDEQGWKEKEKCETQWRNEDVEFPFFTEIEIGIGTFFLTDTCLEKMCDVPHSCARYVDRTFFWYVLTKFLVYHISCFKSVSWTMTIKNGQC